MAVSSKMAVFWVVAPCGLVSVYKRFGVRYWLHHQGDLNISGRRFTLRNELLRRFLVPPWAPLQIKHHE
jgi:hypothetical protein